MANNDSKICINNTYENLKDQISRRREKVKLMLEKKIDDYYENLLEIIENEKKKHDSNEEFEQTLLKD